MSTIQDFIDNCNVDMIFCIIDNNTGKEIWFGDFYKASNYGSYKVIRTEVVLGQLWLYVEI